jgi:hypothetical protein
MVPRIIPKSVTAIMFWCLIAAARGFWRNVWPTSDRFSQIRQDDFDCVSFFKKGVARLKNHAHAALPKSTFKEIATV